METNTPKKHPAVFSSTANTRVVLDVVCENYPWLAKSEENLKMLFDFIWEHELGGFTIPNVREAIQELGPALERREVPAAEVKDWIERRKR